jgi:hypothetical protein
MLRYVCEVRVLRSKSHKRGGTHPEIFIFVNSANKVELCKWDLKNVFNFAFWLP